MSQVQDGWEVESLLPRLKRDWEGRVVRLRVPMKTNGGITFRRGTLMKVERNFGGLNLSKLEECATCGDGRTAYIRKVALCDIELLKRRSKAPEKRLPLAPHELLLRAVHACAPESSQDGLRWTAVAERFGVGATAAVQICEFFGFNPYESDKGSVS